MGAQNNTERAFRALIPMFYIANHRCEIRACRWIDNNNLIWTQFGLAANGYRPSSIYSNGNPIYFDLDVINLVWTGASDITSRAMMIMSCIDKPYFAMDYYFYIVIYRTEFYLSVVTEL